MIVELNGFSLQLSVAAARHGHWVSIPLDKGDGRCEGQLAGVSVQLRLSRRGDRIEYRLSVRSEFPTRLRLQAKLLDKRELFHLIPGSIHGDNNAAHVRGGEFPVLTGDRTCERNRAALWEFRADRASLPVSVLCCSAGAVGVSISPYSEDRSAVEGFIRNGVFASLPDTLGVSLGYGNDPLTFVEKTYFRAATSDLTREAEASGAILAVRGPGRGAAHAIMRALYEEMRELPTFRKGYAEALAGLAGAFATVNWSADLRQYTNRRCKVPADRTLTPWRAVVEIGWTGGSMLAYPFCVAEHLCRDLTLPKSGRQIFDEICAGHNERTGFINDAAVNRFTVNRPEGWNASEVNGWWSGFLPQTRDNHCAYTNGHAAYYLLRAVMFEKRRERDPSDLWIKTALRVLDTAVALQREDGALGYVFSATEPKVVDCDGFAGCWFAAALPLAWRLTGDSRYGDAARRALAYYAPFVRGLAVWGNPMDTYKSIDSEGNLAFIRATRLMHELTGDDAYLDMLLDGAHYEYLWRYGFRTRPECPPLKDSSWNSCGGTITSVSNPHVHPMGVVATDDLQYLARVSSDDYHTRRADDGMAWLMNTMELYPDVVGYGRYGVLSERTCPSDGLLSEVYHDTGSPASTWWSYNAWAAGSAMEAIGQQLLSGREEPHG